MNILAAFLSPVVIAFVVLTNSRVEALTFGETEVTCPIDGKRFTVWRLCSSQIPDVGRIVACLRANRPQLSDGCRAVFAGPPTEPGPRGQSR